MLHTFDMDSFTPGSTSVPQEVFELSNHSLISPSVFHLDFSKDTSSQAASQNVLPPLQDIPGPSSVQLWAPAMPLDNGMRNRGACFIEETGTGSCITCDIHSPIVVPVIPLVRFAQSVPAENIPI